MAMSRTARILVAILLLAAAAFFWVNFYYQSQSAELPAGDPVTADGEPLVTPATEDVAVAAEDAALAADGGLADGEGLTGDATVVDEEPAAAADPDAAAATEPAADVARLDGEAAATVDDTDAQDAQAAGGAALDPVSEAAAGPAAGEPVATDAPPLVVLDAPVSVSRDIVIADLPFLVTAPQVTASAAEVNEAVEIAPFQGVTTPTRATVNPFSPVVVRTPDAPDREVPGASDVVDVPVPAQPVAQTPPPAPVRAEAPTPRALAPATSTSELPRALPTGAVLSSTPALLREPRIGSVAEVVDFAAVAAISVPDAEPTDLGQRELAEVPSVRVADPMPIGPIAVPEPEPEVDPEVLAAAQAEADAAAAGAGSQASGPPPLAVGASPLARYLRDRNYSFTGSVLGPVNVGVFRSDHDSVPVVVALGQTLPETDIVLTDLRGQQAELRLGENTQILTLDLRR